MAGRWSRGGTMNTIRRWWVAAVVIVAMATAGTAGAETLDQVVPTLAQRLTDAAALRGHEIAMGDFEQGRGQYSELSSHLSDLLEAALAPQQTPQGFILIRRDMRTDAVKEMRFGLSDVASQQQAQQYAELLRATALVTGSITDRLTHVVVIARVIDLATTRVVAAHSVSVQKDVGIRALMAKMLGSSQASPPPLGPGPQVSSVVFAGAPPGDPRLLVRVWTDRPSYRIGETLRFHFMTSRNAYVTLVNHGTSGRSTILFPNAFSKGNAVQGGTTYSLPGPGDGYEFRIQPPAGQDLVRIIATDTPWSPTVLNQPGAGVTFRSLDVVEGRTVTRDISVMQKATPPTQRAEEIVRIQVGE